MRNSIMTEKIARRGVRALGEYAVDHLDRLFVRDIGLREVVTLRATDSVAAARAWLATGATGTSHQGFPLVDDAGRLAGVVTRKDLYREVAPGTPLHALSSRPLVVISDDGSLREAADLMAEQQIGRLPVVARTEPLKLLGILTRSDLIAAHVGRLDEQRLERAPLRAKPPSVPDEGR